MRYEDLVNRAAKVLLAEADKDGPPPGLDPDDDEQVARWVVHTVFGTLGLKRVVRAGRAVYEVTNG